MDDPFRTLHFHLGVDNVCEDAFEQVLALKLAANELPHVTFVQESFYKKHLRQTVDSGQGMISDDALSALGLYTYGLAISRPRVLFGGLLMNTEFGAKKALNKVVNIQTAFSEFRIVFHLFIVDHASYLFGPKKREVSLEPNTHVSWAPLAQGLKAKLIGENELRLYDAENVTALFEALIVELLDHSPSEAAKLYQNHKFGHKSRLKPEDLERRVEIAGWNIDVLDDCYTRDIALLFSGFT